MARMAGTLLFFIIVACVFSGCHTLLADEGGGESTPAPEIILPRPTSPAHLTYLGVPSNPQPLSLNEVKAKVIVIEIFNMYCPHCQREAPQVNSLFELIQSRGLQDKIKIIGIGGRNSDFEVKLFQEKYNIPFPLFSDPDFTNTYKLLTDVQTPSFFVLNKGVLGKRKIAYSLTGGFANPESFLDTILPITNLK